MTGVLRRHGAAAVGQFGLGLVERKALSRLVQCRTEALGWHVYVCPSCGTAITQFNACRNRHCPQCQGARRAAWVKRREATMLPVGHFQVVFTLPDLLRPLARAHPAEVYGLMLRTAATTLQTLAADRLGVTLGLTAVLHTWSRALVLHPHVHCLVTAGGLSLADRAWQDLDPNYLLPDRVVAQLFRGRLLAGLQRLHDEGRLQLAEDECADAKAWVKTRRAVYRKRWIVHVDPPLGRRPEQLVLYLARYVYGVAIHDARLVQVTDDTVTFRTRDPGTVTVSGPEFVRRFLLHVLPSGFVKVRHYGLYSPAQVPKGLVEARRQLTRREAPAAEPMSHHPVDDAPALDGDAQQEPGPCCPRCGTGLVLTMVFHPPRGPPPW